MQTINGVRSAVGAATVASLVLIAAPAIADDLSLSVGSSAGVSTLPNNSNATGPGLGIGADGNGKAGLDLNTLTNDQASSTNFQSSRLTVPDPLDRLSIRTDSKGKASVLYNFVNTKF